MKIDVNTYDYEIIKLTLLNPQKVKEQLVEALESEINNYSDYGDEEDDEEAKEKKRKYELTESRLQELEYIRTN